MDWILWLLGGIGHIGFWCVVFNRIHATAWPRPSRKATEKGIILAVVLPLAWVVSILVKAQSFATGILSKYPLTQAYFYACVLLGCFFVVCWAWRKSVTRLPKSVLENRREWIDVRSQVGKPLFHGFVAKTLGLVPFNEAVKLTRQRMTFSLNVPKSCDGLKICQLSDLHFTGQLGIEYFHHVVEEANQFEPDLIVVTGDLVDKTKCLPWLDSTLGKLRASIGVFYVLGNHDRRIKEETEFRNRLDDLGLIQASGKWSEVQYRGNRIQITGNELPWYPAAESLPDSDRKGVDLRILLSHSPDQLDWALERGFDLMFAGHTHGGQIAFPLIGPIVAPSKYGVRYASGTFQIGEMLMHVSRGISGDEPIRFCSPPELGLFTIRSNHA